MWLVVELHHGAVAVPQVAVIGLCNGALYALIALGYTMVYGIIELINFAHGDLFMLGSVFAAAMIADVLGVSESSPAAWLAFAVALSRCADGVLRARSTSAIERLAYRRLRNAPKLAPLITAVGMSASSSRTSASLERLGAEVGVASVLPHGVALDSARIRIPWKYLVVHRRHRSRCCC